MYRMMVTIRRFEETIRDLFFQGQIPGFVHVSIGEEAVPTGVCAALVRQGLHHHDAPRPRPHARQGRRAQADDGRAVRQEAPATARARAARCTSSATISASSAPTASSAAASRSPPARRWPPAFVATTRWRSRSSATAPPTRAPSTSRSTSPACGSCRSSIVCQNNCYAEFTPTSESTAVKDIAMRAQGYNMPGVIVDGNDVLAVYEVDQDGGGARQTRRGTDADRGQDVPLGRARRRRAGLRR